MKLELQQELFGRYPKFFRKPGKRLGPGSSAVRVDLISSDGFDQSLEFAPENPTDSPGSPHKDIAPFDQRGVECDDGWFTLIDCLSQACEMEIERLISEGVPKEYWPRIAQIKEKFGGLRFYVNGVVSGELQAWIRVAENEESYRTCERCGQPGKLRTGRWAHTYCDHCQMECEDLREASELSWGEYDRYCATLKVVLDSRAE